MSDKLASIIDTVKALTVMELADLVKALEKEFGVSAAAVAGPAGPAAAAAVEAPTSFKVTLVEVPADKKISAIKCVREILGLGLADAKAFVEGVPKVVKEGIEKPAADELAKKLTEAGGKAKIEGA
jgi:large subunit ribosomal protein L7/L12